MTVSLGFYADADTRITLHEYGTDRAPILALDNPGTWLTVGALDPVPLADHLAFARQLADATARYVTALERFATAQTADSTEVA